MNPLDELRLHAEALKHAAKANAEFFAAHQSYIERLASLLVSFRVEAVPELVVITNHLEAFFDKYRSKGESLYIPPRAASASDGAMRRILLLTNKIAAMPQSEVAALNPPANKGDALVTTVENSRSVFIVHGHDNEAKLEAERLVKALGLVAVILSEQPSQGRTIIEKFEEHAKQAAFALVLLTPDDVGGKAGAPTNLQPRARQK